MLRCTGLLLAGCVPRVTATLAGKPGGSVDSHRAAERLEASLERREHLPQMVAIVVGDVEQEFPRIDDHSTEAEPSSARPPMGTRRLIRFMRMRRRACEAGRARAKLSGTLVARLADAILSEGRVLVTLDRDFADTRAYPPERYPGIVVVRRQDASHVSAVMHRLVPVLRVEPVASRRLDSRLLHRDAERRSQCRSANQTSWSF